MSSHDTTSELKDLNPSRVQAWHDFRNLPPESRGNINALLRIYEARRKEGGVVPTVDRNYLYRWSREDRWRQRLVEELSVELEEESRRLFGERSRQVDELTRLLPAVNEVFKDLLGSDKDPALRHRVAMDILDRIGIVKQSKLGTQSRELRDDVAASQPPPSEVHPLPDDADESDFMRLLQERRAAT